MERSDGRHRSVPKSARSGRLCARARRQQRLRRSGGRKILETIESVADEGITVLAVDDPTLVNALQRSAAVVLQKSFREGFGLTVTEAM